MKTRNLICAVLAAVIFISFFLPWVHAESQMIGSVTKVLTGKRQAEITNISGFNVPILANGPDARLIISIIQIFNPGVTDADKKSWLIWGVPLLAVAIFAAGIRLDQNKWYNLAIAIIGILVFLVGVYKIKTTDLDKLVLNARIGIGLWLTLYGYLGLGLAAAACYAKGLVGKK